MRRAKTRWRMRSSFARRRPEARAGAAMATPEFDGGSLSSGSRRCNGAVGPRRGGALDGMTLDPGIIARDRKQSFFAQSFTAFSAKLISQNRLQAGAAQLKKHSALLAKVEQQYGVQGPVIVAFWALESDFGAGMGNLSVLRSLATLAYDCRRSEMFRDELMDALRIIDRGDLRPEEMIGSWAGELGQ